MKMVNEIKMEPLATVASLNKFLLKMVAKQWYDFERSTFTYLSKLSQPGFEGKLSLVLAFFSYDSINSDFSFQ